MLNACFEKVAAIKFWHNPDKNTQIQHIFILNSKSSKEKIDN